MSSCAFDDVFTFGPEKKKRRKNSLTMCPGLMSTDFLVVSGYCKLESITAVKP